MAKATMKLRPWTKADVSKDPGDHEQPECIGDARPLVPPQDSPMELTSVVRRLPNEAPPQTDEVYRLARVV
jgi:hypothetical protein